MTNLATEVARLKREVAQVKKGQRVSHGASIENAAIEVRDDDGSLRAIVGQQGDGTTGAVIVNGPPPPQPSDPIVVSVIGGVTASWDGLFAGGAVMPLDWSRIEVHASTAADYVPDSVTLQSTIETPQGATVVIACENNVYVRFVARSTSGTASTPSGIVGPVGPAPVVAGDILDGIVTTAKLADDAVTQAKVAVGAIGTTEITDNAITTPKIVAGAVQTAQLDAEAVNASKIAAGAVTTVKLAALAVTANELAANAVTASKILAGSVSAQALTIGVAQSIVTKLTDTMADSSTWARVGESGTYATVTGVTDAVAGSTVMQVSGTASMERTENIPYDAAALYRVTVRLRTTTAPTSGSATVYLGVSGIAADGTTRVNVTGANAITSQHYITLSNTAITAGTAWTTVTGYLQGTAATGTAVTSADPRSPGKAHTNVRYIRPLLRLLNGATGGVMQVDQVTVETVPTGVVNAVNIVDGAVTADALSANSVTTVKLAAGSVDATALKADAITGKTITGGTITGTTVTGSVVQTGTTGTRLRMAPDAGGSSIPGLALYSGAPAETAPGILWSTVVTVGSTVQPMTVLQAPYVDAGSARFDLTSPVGGIGGKFRLDTNSTRSYVYISGRDGTTADPSVIELFAQNGVSGSSSVMQIKGTQIYLRSSDVTVDGILTAGNMAFGQVSVTPSAPYTPTSATVFYSVKGTTFFGQATPNSTVPGYRAAATPPGAGITGVSVSSATATSMLVWVNRENTTATNVNWLVTSA
ncbi:hypothetical protein ACIOEZ_34270 [Streptomyces sp. NPDC087866]|uniref:hypothetical protein n=1 Tax=Streptomyces sp. NPDC087866 TaxID=3365815 RepID=UPI0037F9B435